MFSHYLSSPIFPSFYRGDYQIDNSTHLLHLILVPIGRGLSDGLTYPVNPRFDEEGRWRSRAEWPEELR